MRVWIDFVSFYDIHEFFVDWEFIDGWYCIDGAAIEASD